MPAKKPHPGRRGSQISMAPLTTEQALAAALRVKPADLAKLEQAEKKKGKRKK